MTLQPESCQRPAELRVEYCRNFRTGKDNIQRFSSLKKVKFYTKHLYEGGFNVIINKPGHMTKMATMSLCGKTLKKSSLQELLKLLQRNLKCSN